MRSLFVKCLSNTQPLPPAPVEVGAPVTTRVWLQSWATNHSPVTKYIYIHYSSIVHRKLSWSSEPILNKNLDITCSGSILDHFDYT